MKGTYTGSPAQDLPRISLQRDLAQQLLQSSCQGDRARDLLHQGNLQILPWYLFVMFLATLFGVCQDNIFSGMV
jgi:hypothetical protein